MVALSRVIKLRRRIFESLITQESNSHNNISIFFHSLIDFHLLIQQCSIASIAQIYVASKWCWWMTKGIARRNLACNWRGASNSVLFFKKKIVKRDKWHRLQPITIFYGLNTCQMVEMLRNTYESIFYVVCGFRFSVRFPFFSLKKWYLRVAR